MFNSFAVVDCLGPAILWTHEIALWGSAFDAMRQRGLPRLPAGRLWG
jgi:hypothetical protein